MNPAWATRPSRARRLLSRILPRWSGPGSSTNSSPVDTTTDTRPPIRGHFVGADTGQHSKAAGRDDGARTEHLLASPHVITSPAQRDLPGFTLHSTITCSPVIRPFADGLSATCMSVELVSSVESAALEARAASVWSNPAGRVLSTMTTASARMAAAHLS